MHTCEWLVSGEDLYSKANNCETPCGKPAVAHIDWGDGIIYWYCAEHYDRRIRFIWFCERWDVLKRSGVL